MSITYTQKSVDANQLQNPQHAPLAYAVEDFKNVKAHYSFLGVFEISVDVDMNRGTATVRLKAFGAQVGYWVLDKQKVSIDINIRPGVYPAAYGELGLKIGVDWSNHGGIFMSGKACACAAFAGCHCAEFKDHYIIHF